jgi:catechol 2,3-dioxygenase-like lactoylglutathione lyase family enzyme
MPVFDHVGIYVKDIDRSVTFYTNIFGWKEKRRMGTEDIKIAVLDIGEGYLEIVQRPGSPGIPPTGNWSHIAFHVENFTEMLNKLVRLGVHVDARLSIANNTNIAFFTDPDGHTVEIMEKGFTKVQLA